jgi:hypothetical protein
MTASHHPTAAERQVAQTAGFGGKPRPTIRILRWRPFTNPSGPVLGLLDVELPSGLQILDIRFGIGSRGGAYVMMPAEKMRDRDDRPLLDDRNKPRGRSLVDFRSKDVRERFSDQVVAALRRAQPELFAGEGGR